VLTILSGVTKTVRLACGPDRFTAYVYGDPVGL